MRVLFVHGAGGYLEDQVMADALSDALDSPVDYPQLSDADMSVDAWAGPVRERLAALGPDDIVVGHSFGATILQWVLPERGWAPRRALLLATPDWSPDGWDVAQYVYDGAEPDMDTSLHHCRDDEVVPFEHLALGAVRMPSARVVEHPAGGHQFEGLAQAIAAEARGA
ncbi:alpha/beta hydrolase [Mumia sp. zg.B17]|uniref:alpha/beta fold hydrolase n=1 Tax=Mumia sp. zg.B17 TaxID=2855446 RepID=UPI001C6E0FF2|nr:alpha/beta hydrolase [Mumia sp. zg.B17]MBW9207535.1 alpha/beta hydrolase [Mumia sp. zg.B17]